jgi:hypothetical protein
MLMETATKCELVNAADPFFIHLDGRVKARSGGSHSRHLNINLIFQ